jgi:hypothetical protein
MSLDFCKGKRIRRLDCERIRRKRSSQTDEEVETALTLRRERFRERRNNETVEQREIRIKKRRERDQSLKLNKNKGINNLRKTKKRRLTKKDLRCIVSDDTGESITINTSSRNTSSSSIENNNMDCDIPMGIDSPNEIDNDNNNSDLATEYIDMSTNFNTEMPTSSSLCGNIQSLNNNDR